MCPKYNKSIYRGIILTLLLFILFPSIAIPGNRKPDSSKVAFISDTQEPMWIEKLWLKSDNNEKATGAIFSSLLKEKNISALVHLGDITAVGFMQSEWDEMNIYFSRLNKAGIPVYPTMGNHEYFILHSKGRKQFFKNFPHIKSTWYVKQFGSLAVILLDSNFSSLSEEEKSSQQTWYENKVRELDENPEVKAVIVGTHHSPFTNSTIVDPSDEVRRAFVPAYLKSKKGRLFLSGHTHAFEHFEYNGKDFLVTGGGGGLLQPLLLGKERRYNDLFPQKTERRMFHYVVCEQKEDSLHIKVKMINPDYKTFTLVYELNKPVK